MLIYESTKQGFLDSVLNDRIAAEITEQYREKIGKPNEKEISSWNDSMQYMFKVLSCDDIPDNAGVAIEFRIPSTSKRVDFLISGSDGNNSVVIVIELKRWNEVELIEGKDGLISTPLGRGWHDTVHPSYQAWSYKHLLRDFNEAVQEENIHIQPCAYLHNLVKEEYPEIEHPVYSYYIDQAPVYTKGEVLKLRDFIKKYIKVGDDRESLYLIENGRLKPSKSLQDHLTSLLKGNREFVMIDDQKIVYEMAVDWAIRSRKDMKKRVIVVEGGPGTGKSVVAVNLLVELTKRGLVTNYVSKNSAPRNIYATHLKGSFTKSHIDNLFKGSGTYVNAEENLFDALIVDEAHRLNEKSGLFKNKGENQIKEIINGSKFSIFFIDEGQRITIHDIGETTEITRFAGKVNATFLQMELASQFRCNGSDGYLAWLDDLLEIRETANKEGFEGDYDFRVIDDPTELRDIIFEKNQYNNKARILAGYCWNWISAGKNNTNVYDIEIPEFDFAMSWNLGGTTTWAIDPESVNEVGCIHTSQGLEFDYVGIIIGPDLRYENGRIVTDFRERAKTDQSLKGIKKLSRKDPQRAKEIADEIIKNTYRTLMTRGMKGCYVYCVDKGLQEYLKDRLKMFNNF